MYSNTSFNFNYDLTVELKDSKTGAVLETFDAREVTTQTFDANFAGGGIASGGQAYTIATSKDLSKYKTRAYSTQAIVDGTDYKVLNIQSMVVKNRSIGSYKRVREFMLYLG